MKEKLKVYIVGNQYGYGQLFIKHGHEITIEMQDADLVCFTGGEDVSPSLYGEKPHIRTYYNPTRDVIERGVFNNCITQEKRMVGICRGGQFLNVMSGGQMYQDVSEHTHDHYITDVDTGMLIFASSTHHQMMRPGPGSELVAIANEGGWKEYMKDGIPFRDPVESDDVEVVYYPLTKSLCFQPHPEFDGFDELQDYFFHVVKKHLF